MTDRVCPEKPYLLDGFPIGMYHCPVCSCMVLAGMEHAAHDPECCCLHDISEDEFAEIVSSYEESNATFTDRETKPDSTMLPPATVWVWVTGPVEPHWALRGTGVIVGEPTDR